MAGRKYSIAKMANILKVTVSDEGNYEAVELRSDVPKYQQYASMTPEQIVSTLTLKQKAAQMMQPAIYNISESDMEINDYGSILSTFGCIDSDEWVSVVDSFQQAAINNMFYN